MLSLFRLPSRLAAAVRSDRAPAPDPGRCPMSFEPLEPRVLLSTTWYVSPTGSNSGAGTESDPWRTIHYAVEANRPTAAGDTILVQPGTYTEEVTLGKSGSTGNPITLKANGEVTLVDPTPLSGGFLEGVIEGRNKAWWVIDGFRIENSYGSGMAFQNVDHLVIQNNHTFQTGTSGIIVMPQSNNFVGGEQEVEVTDVKVLNNTVERANWRFLGGLDGTLQDPGSPQEALSVWGVDGFEVAFNTVFDGLKEGIDVKTGSRNGTVHHNTVYNQARVSGTFRSYRGGPALYLDGNRSNMFNIDVFNNVVHSNVADGITVADEKPNQGGLSDIRVFNNLSYRNGTLGDNTGSGIRVATNVTGIEVYHNTLHRNVTSITVDGNFNNNIDPVEDAVITNNIFARPVNRGVLIANADNIVFDDNLFSEVDNNGGFEPNNGDTFDVKASATNVTLTDNTEFVNVSALGFTDAAGDGYTLTAASPAVDAADAAAGLVASDDLLGNARPIGAGYDQGAYELQAAPPADGGTIGESGRLAAVNQAWQTVNLNNTYLDPVVVVGPASYNGVDPTTVRVRNVTATSFQVQVDEWDYLDGGHADETISYLVVEAGRHVLEDGTVLEAGNAGGVNAGFANVGFASGFAAAPVVLSQTVTTNEASAVVTRMRNVSTSGFELRVQEEEAADGVHTNETVAWIAIEAGSGSTGGKLFEAGATGDTVTEASTTINFANTYGGSHAFLANLQTFDGGDTSTLRYTTLANGSASIFLEEEASLDAELAHTTENVGYVVLAAGDLVAGSGGPGGSGGTLAATVELDPYNGNDFFQFRVANDSDSASIDSIDFAITGGGVFDLFEAGSGFTVTPDVGGNSDGVNSSTVTVDFTGAGLAAGGNASNSASGNKSDFDGAITGIDVTIRFDDGSTLAGTLTDVGDADDGNAALWSFAGSAAATDPVGVELAVDPYNGFEFFQFRAANTSASASITSITLTITGGAVFDLFESNGDYAVVENLGVNSDGVFSSTVTLDFTGTGLAAGASTSNSSSGNKSDLDDNGGDVTGIDFVVDFSDGQSLAGSLVEIGDTDDGNPLLWRFA